MSELRAAGLGVAYGETVAVRPLDLHVDSGRMLSVTGPSGAGKSSLLWALACAFRPAAASVTGTVRVDGSVLKDRDAAARAGVVLVPQRNGLSGTLSAEESILVPLLALGVPAREALRRVDESLTRVGLADSSRHLVDQLSGGQQQRVALARAFALRPAVLLADESTSDLDAGNRELMMAALREEADRGAAVVLATHDPEAAARTDATLALDEGESTGVREM
ncbi:ABC transporter ATP-binding protein [Nocardioides szechwanensis]|uniref:Putative ABC transport system ATP-binding protein n=1 Tax=Nocardioides szechwanensis TaxID=1005944 RepID=A0A1H0JI26_9ACTN|nr:ATP-binding cassette domain-containing protein [Nocardioides szechwanensis]GEP35132.1 ABC transporter ATP-binding protein [Nocardioides szechwanensis]SDO43428.1 putative ABC transport system ATP-binding protein [Nocardioides szechwanensis]